MDLVFDRSPEDVRLGNEKGYYSATDLNRVESAVQQLQQLARQLDIHLQLQTKTDWVFPEEYSPQTWPTKLQMERYLRNVAQLCKGCGVACMLPTSMEYLDWQHANWIEAALHQTEKRIKSVLQEYRFSGEAFSGEENII